MKGIIIYFFSLCVNYVVVSMIYFNEIMDYHSLWPAIFGSPIALLVIFIFLFGTEGIIKKHKADRFNSYVVGNVVFLLVGLVGFHLGMKLAFHIISYMMLGSFGF